MRFNDRAEARAFVEDNSQIVDQVATNPFSMVRVQCVINGQVYDSARFAKYNPNDALPKLSKKQMPDSAKRALYNKRRAKLAYNRQRGLDIAYGRAITDIVNALLMTGHVTLATIQEVNEEETK